MSSPCSVAPAGSEAHLLDGSADARHYSSRLCCVFGPNHRRLEEFEVDVKLLVLEHPLTSIGLGGRLYNHIPAAYHCRRERAEDLKQCAEHQLSPAWPGRVIDCRRFCQCSDVFPISVGSLRQMVGRSHYFLHIMTGVLEWGRVGEGEET